MKFDPIRPNFRFQRRDFFFFFFGAAAVFFGQRFLKFEDFAKVASASSVERSLDLVPQAGWTNGVSIGLPVAGWTSVLREDANRRAPVGWTAPGTVTTLKTPGITWAS